ncbi:hypothetical protein [Nocardioides sp. InS609-2]|uniref:hypothetical protein n=1 Tax=Nocardioides sp. InS609-2 TaxID=2760705 RepID=UPI0020BDA3EF|nr:hypothetical protein [Nocardioides sp. InS609-2]
MLATLGALALGGCTDDSPPSSTPSRSATPSTTATPSPTPTEPPTPTPTPGGRHAVRLDPAAPRGAEPAAPWLIGRTLHRDGSTLELPRAYDQFATLGDRVFAVRSDDQGRMTLDEIDASGTVTASNATYGMAVNADRTNLVWTSGRGHIHTVWAAGDADMAKQPARVRPVTITGPGAADGSCLETEHDRGCVVFFNNDNGAGPQYTSSHGITDIVGPSSLQVADASGGLVAVQTGVSDDGSCWEVLRGWKQQWRTCANTLLDFSPDASLLLASDAYLDGIGPRSLTVLDAKDGTTVVSFRTGRGFIGSWLWEDDRHLLVTTYDAGRWNLLRAGIDGSVEAAIAPDSSSDELNRPFAVAGAH